MKTVGYSKLLITALISVICFGVILPTGCGGGNGSNNSGQTDNEPPEVYVMLDEPIFPRNGDYAHFIAGADDESGIDTIAIFVNGQNIAQADGGESAKHLQCDGSAGPYSQGYVIEYYAFAVDTAGNEAKCQVKKIIVGE